MTGRDIFKIWAPVGAKWTDWVRPVPFVAIDDDIENDEFYDFSIINLNYIKTLAKDTAIIVDLPGYNSVKEGIALAKLGFRPIPIYNGTNEQKGAKSTTNNHSVSNALMWGSSELDKIKLLNDAPPAFLLDSNRMHRYKMSISIFDNSWDIYDQDVPSAKYFLENGITNLIVRGASIQKDLRKILYQYQKKGLKILFTSGYDELKEITIKKPSRKYK